MTRQEAVDKLCDVYAGSFDVTRHEEARQKADTARISMEYTAL